jgi:single-strand DNA-binding protein
MFKMIITGNVGRDVEMRADQNGNMFATFSVGVNVGFKENKKTEWVSVSCNGKLADTAKQYIGKGSKLLIEGTPSINQYDTKAGEHVAAFKLNAHSIEFIGSKPEVDNQQDYNTSHHTLPNNETPF